MTPRPDLLKGKGGSGRVAPRKEPTVNDARVRELVQDYLDVKEAIEKHTERLAQLAAQIRDALPIGDRHEIVPGVGVRVQAPARRFSADLAASTLDAGLIDAITVPTVSGAKAKQILPPALYEACCEANGDPTVRVL